MIINVKRSGARHLVCFVLSFLLLAQSAHAYQSYPEEGTDIPQAKPSPGATEAAQVLGVVPNVKRIIELEDSARGDNSAAQKELLLNTSIVLRRILIGYLDVRQTCDKIEVNLGRTYASMEKVSRKQALRVQLFNMANFSQYATMVITASTLRMHQQFHAAIALMNVSAGLTLIFSSMALWSGLSGKSKDKVQPNEIAAFIDPDTPFDCQFPKSINRYLNLPAPGETKTRREQLLTKWHSQQHIDISQKAKINALAASPQNKHGEKMGLLEKRVALLYTLKASVEQFDGDLLGLLQYVESNSNIQTEQNTLQATLDESSVSPAAYEAAKLLKVRREVARLIQLRRQYGNHVATIEQLRLEIFILERILGGALEVRSVLGRIDREKSYEYDVVLSQLTAARDRAVLLANTANFTEIGALKSIAAGKFWAEEKVHAIEILMVMSSISMLLGALAVQLDRGGKRKLDSYTNVLANIFDLNQPDEYKFSPLISEYLNAVPPNSKHNLTRKQRIIAHWKEHKVLSIEDKPKEFKKFASLEELRNKRTDSIKLVNRRLRMLFDTRALIESLDANLLELLNAVS